MQYQQPYPELHLYIDGQWMTGEQRKVYDVIDPATEEVLGQLPLASDQDVEQAIYAAHRAFASWRLVPAPERAHILRTAAGYLREDQVRLGDLITRELGKPTDEAVREVITAAEMFEWSAEEARRLYGRVIPARSPGYRQVALLEPIGPVAAFSGWNAPAITPSRKIGGALAAGCTVVIKPSEETPAIALALAHALEKAGLPKGVLNMVFGDAGRISELLVDSPLISAVTFTGSTEIGKQLAIQGGKTLKRMTLELGGHAPVLIFGDADVDAAVNALAAGKLRNSGQICTSPTRFNVHESIYETFTDKLVKKFKAHKVGHGRAAGVQMGPLANSRRLESMQRMVADAHERGVEVVTGGERLPGKGFFFEPTIFKGYGDDCLAANSEPFGPLALVRPFSNFDEAITQANRLPFGLAAYVFTQGMQTAQAASEGIESGVVCINHCQASLPETPFGGVKDSGYGSEGGSEGIREFMKVKYITQA